MLLCHFLTVFFLLPVGYSVMWVSSVQHVRGRGWANCVAAPPGAPATSSSWSACEEESPAHRVYFSTVSLKVKCTLLLCFPLKVYATVMFSWSLQLCTVFLKVKCTLLLCSVHYCTISLKVTCTSLHYCSVFIKGALVSLFPLKCTPHDQQ